MPKLSIVLPAYNEAGCIGDVVTELKQRFPDAEVLVVNDSSTDSTAAEAAEAGARVVTHKYNMGNGAAIKTGARNARGKTLVFMDADGQHKPEDIPRLLQKLETGYEMIVGARSSTSQASIGRWMGNNLLNRVASILTGHVIDDLTSGFRATTADTFRKFLYLLPNGFSYPTTSTMAFLRSGLPVGFVPIEAQKRKGQSKINFIRDGIRFLIIVMKVTTLFSPMRVFFPLSALVFFVGFVRYLYFYIQTGSFSSMAGVLFITAMLIFLIGLISEQITTMNYGASVAFYHREKDDDIK